MFFPPQYWLTDIHYSIPAEEMVEFSCGVRAMCLNLEADNVGVSIFGNDRLIKEGDTILLNIPAKLSMFLLAQVSSDVSLKLLVTPSTAKALLNLLNIVVPLWRHPVSFLIILPTSLWWLASNLLMLWYPSVVGQHQHELIIGDCQTGKTAIAIDTILKQKIWNDGDDESKKLYSVYVQVSIGQKCSPVAQIVQTLEENDVMKYTIIVTATASEAATLQYLAHFSGCAM
jgi:F-type H+-transporting ATPase subunit alpha